MILDMVLAICVWMGIMFAVLPMVIQNRIFEVLPFHLLGVIWLVIGIILVIYRGKASGYWMLLDFPVKDSVIDFHVDQITLKPVRLYKSRIEGLLKTKAGTKYYRDHARSALFTGGHEARLSKDGVNHLLNVDDVILTQKLVSMGITDINEMDAEIKKQMLMLKDVDANGNDLDTYLLTGTTTPSETLDIEDNATHKQVYDALCQQASISLADGGTISFYQYNHFQKALGSSTDMASVIDYVRSDEAAKATKIKKAMGMNGMVIAVIIIAVVLVVGVLAFMFLGGGTPGM